QQPEVALSLEPLKNDGSTSSELASFVGEDKSPSSTSSLTTSPKDRLQSSRPATEIRTEATASTPNTPDQKIESKQATANSRTKAAGNAAQKQAAVTTVKPSVLPEESVKAGIEEPKKDLPQPVKPPIVAQLTKDSSLEQAKTPAAEIPAAQSQVETPKIISELKEKPAEPVSVTPAKDSSVPRTNERETTPIPQAITKNESARETSARVTKTVTKAATQPVQTSKNEAATSESAASKVAAEKVTNIPDKAKAQIETPKPKPEEPITPATSFEKSLGVAGREFVSNSAAKSPSEKVSTNIAEKAAVPIVTAKTTIEKAVVPEKESVPIPSIQTERESTTSRVQPLQDRGPLSSKLDPAQNALPKPIMREEKQADRATESEARTIAKRSEVLPSPQSKTASPAIAAPEASREKQPEQLALIRKPADVI